MATSRVNFGRPSFSVIASMTAWSFGMAPARHRLMAKRHVSIVRWSAFGPAMARASPYFL